MLISYIRIKRKKLDFVKVYSLLKFFMCVS